MAIWSAFSSMRAPARPSGAIERPVRRCSATNARSGGDFARQAGLPDHDRHQRAVDPLQMADQFRLDPVARQPHRTALQQRLGARRAARS